MMDGLVYYALDATREGLQLKIGHTTNLRTRMANLRNDTASRQVPIILAVEAGGLQLERQRQEEFADLRLHGEWFRYADRLVAHVAGLDDPFEYLSARSELVQFAVGWRSLVPASTPSDSQFEGLDHDEALRALMEISDPMDRARAAQILVATVEAEIREAQQGRDQAICEARNDPGRGETVDQLAAYIGVRRSIVVDAMRGRQKRA